jgi:acetyl esterase/lipase
MPSITCARNKLPRIPDMKNTCKLIYMKSCLFLITMALPALGGGWQNLWPVEAPGAPRPPAGTEIVQNDWRFSEVEVPQYHVFHPENPNGMCVVVLPGGGYGTLAGDHEGRKFGEWFAKRGITTVLVKYRVSGSDGKKYHFPVPQMDARRAIRVARGMAREWRIDPERVGIMGFSAGGHLASCCLTMFNETFPQETRDAIDALSCRPSFGILVYPVISMNKPHGHTVSLRRLLGENPPADLVTRCSTALHVTRDTPPVLVVHSADDAAVPLRNSLDFIDACASRKVPVSALIFSTGGHGYGFAGKGEAAGWTAQLAEWLNHR